MLFFRSEDHLRNWAQYDPSIEDGISQVKGLLAMFSSNVFKKRMNPDYFSNMKNYLGELIGEMGDIEGLGNFLRRQP